MGLYSGGLIIGRIFASEIWGAYFVLFFLGGEFLSEFYGMLVLGLLSPFILRHARLRAAFGEDEFGTGAPRVQGTSKYYYVHG